ncbi:TIM barrel protein [Prauserella endophytica]|uniref:TIM barrel protein n=1 Tax=Prauserella endophytica TaxID=1592324 RepID=A0ABY2S6S7_9PSEU|nr:TIM barrel protein [Prauserella endophytica]TKG71618.1 TIM barrel protein [Prauserella endophytica]
MTSPSRFRVAGAPISWGVCEVPGWGTQLDVTTVLGQMAELGLGATELGPPGYLPTEPGALRALLSEYALGLVGGFLAVPMHTEPERARAAAEESAALLAECGAEVLVLAAATGLDGYDERPALDYRGWRALVTTAEEIQVLARRHGLRAVLHPHVGTHVEREDEVERFLADSSLPLCLDTGHLLVGGTDPVALARRHPARIGHVHLKDVRADLAGRVRAGELDYTAAVGQGLYVPLGDGDVDLAAMVGFVRAAGYPGWYVLEQDTVLGEHDTGDRPKRDTARSLAYLNDLVSRLPAG